MTKGKKGLSIGAAMKQRMSSQEAASEEEKSPLALAPSVSPPASESEADYLESFNTRLPRSLHRRLKVHAAQEGMKIQDVVQHALDEYLSQFEK